MKHSDARYQKTGMLMYDNTQLWSFFFLQICSHLCLCTLTILTHAHTCVCRHTFSLLSLCKGFDLWPKDGVKGIHSKVFGGEKKWWRDSQNNNLAIDFCSVQKGAAKSCAAREGLVPRLDEQIVNNMTYQIQATHCDFYSISNHHKELHKDDLL